MIQLYPARPLLVPSPFPISPMTFAGWGSIIGPDKWTNDFGAMQPHIRETIRGCSRLAPVPASYGPRRLVIGCEKRTQWLKADRLIDARTIDNTLVAIYHALKAINGPDCELAFSGPEDAIVGDFTTPMLGPHHSAAIWPRLWDHRMPMPFIAPRYGATAAHTANVLRFIADNSGLSRGVILWMQEETAESQAAVIRFGQDVARMFGGGEA